MRYGDLLRKNKFIAIIAIILFLILAWRSSSSEEKHPIVQSDDKEISTFSEENHSNEDDMRKVNSKALSSTQNNVEEYTVYITGAIKNPGIQKVSQGTRLYEVIEKAGGFLDDAENEKINLAAKVEDSMHYIIPRKGDEITSDLQPLLNSKNGGSQSGALPDGRININKADKNELMQLDGIGETLAERIVTYREQNGLFSAPEDLLKVSGIGNKKYEAIQGKIMVP